MQSHPDDSHLVELIYAALLGESDWQTFLDRLAGDMPGCWSVLHAHDAMQNAASVGLLSGRQPDDIANYSEYYHDLNPWTAYCQTNPVGGVLVVEQVVDGNHLERSEFYADFLRPAETRSSVGVALDRSEGRSLLLSVMTPNADEGQIRPLADQLRRLAPHLLRASDFYRRTSYAERLTELGATLLDSLHMGVVIVGAGGHLRSVSDQARRMFGPAVGTDPFGRLRMGSDESQALFSMMLRADYDGPRRQQVSVGDRLLTLIRMEGAREGSFFDGPGLCVTIESTRGGGRHLDIQHFAACHRLTGAETRALDGLLSGKTVDEIAREAGRSRETIRSQLKTLYLKTGTNGQADLMRLVSGMRH